MAVTVAARAAGPRAAVRTKAARGGKASARRAPAGGPSPKLERDRAAIQAIKDSRPDPEAQPVDGRPEDKPSVPAGAVPSPTSSGGGPPQQLVMPAAASTGSGFMLGVFAWALGLAYLRGGGAEVRRFMAAKFLNKVTTP